MAIQIISRSIRVFRPTQRSGIYRGERLLELLMGRAFLAFPVAGDGGVSATLTATATPTMCSTMQPHVRPRSGISTITFTSAARTAQLFLLAGSSWEQLILIATADLIICL